MSAAGAVAIAVACAVAALVGSEWRGWRPGVFVAKPLASAGVIALAWTQGASGSSYGRVLLAGLVLCALGDVLLIPKGARAAFLGGLVSFLLGHVAFAIAFGLRAFAAAAAAGMALLLAPAAGAALRWLGPHVPRSLVWPVRSYVFVISAMVAAAAGAALGSGAPVLLLGALSFFVSDLAVARERFVVSSPWNKVWGLPLYYAGTGLLAATAGAVLGP